MTRQSALERLPKKQKLSRPLTRRRKTRRCVRVRVRDSARGSHRQPREMGVGASRVRWQKGLGAPRRCRQGPASYVGPRLTTLGAHEHGEAVSPSQKILVTKDTVLQPDNGGKLVQVTTWKGLGDIILSAISQRQKDEHCVTPLTGCTHRRQRRWGWCSAGLGGVMGMAVWWAQSSR